MPKRPKIITITQTELQTLIDCYEYFDATIGAVDDEPAKEFRKYMRNLDNIFKKNGYPTLKKKFK